MNERLFILFHKYHSRSISDAEQEELFLLMDDEDNAEEVQTLISEAFEHPQPIDKMPEDRAAIVLQTILGAKETDAEYEPVVVRMKPVQRWLKIAAAVLLLAIGAGVWYQLERLEDAAQKKFIGRTEPDISPATQKAYLTIDNQQTVDLSDSKQGIIVNKGVQYNDGEKIADAASQIQLTTPRGGRYVAELPDGTKVWLNAASSIQFPARFTGNERVVEVEGEVFFDVVRNNNMPFRVKINKGAIEVDVLGTRFNVNAYNNEPVVKTVLLDGAVKVKTNGQTQLLKPGQQAEVDYSQRLKLIERIDTNKVVSWKNGVFDFEGLPFDEAMRQLERWYDIEIKYAGSNPSLKFKGILPRNLPLTELLEILREVDVKYRIEGRTLIIL